MRLHIILCRCIIIIIGKLSSEEYAKLFVVEMSEVLSVEDLSGFKYTLIVFCDVERSFSKYRSLFRDNRRSFKFENLKLIFNTGTLVLVPQ